MISTNDIDSGCLYPRIACVSFRSSRTSSARSLPLKPDTMRFSISMSARKAA